MLRPADADAGRTARAAEWVRRPERGSATLLRMMMFVSLRLGRPLGRCILHGIAAYFFTFAPAARRASRDYLRRALGREPGALDRYAQVFAFASTILDRLYLVKERYELLDVSIEGEELMHELLARGQSAFLLGAHLGSFELMSTVGRRQPGLRVAMAMYEPQANLVATLFGHPPNAPEVIPLGHLDAMLRIRDCVERGHHVGMLADRTLGEAAGQVVNFLGRPALFPTGPMRVAAALRCPVIFMTGLYRGGNRYHVVFRALADFSQVSPAARERAVHAGIERYAAELEAFCRSDPYNWFNFYDFWHGAGSCAGNTRRGPPAGGAGT